MLGCFMINAIYDQSLGFEVKHKSFGLIHLLYGFFLLSQISINFLSKWWYFISFFGY